MTADRTADIVADPNGLIQSLLGASGDCIKILDLEGNLLFMSERGKRVMEVTDFGAIKGCAWPSFWKDQGHIDAKAAIEAARAGGTGHFQGFATTMAGTPKWWDVTVSLIRDADGKPDRLLSVSRDITASRASELALRESETQFKTFAQAMPNQVWSARPDGQLDWFNEQVFAFSGLQFSDLSGNNWAQMVHQEDVSTAAAAWAQALADSTPYEAEFRLRRADGAFRWHIARALPIKDDSGRTVRWIGTNTDVEKQKSAEARQKLLAGELEHRIKNTMAMIAAIANQTFRTANSMEQAHATFDARLFALSQAHSVLTETSWTGASMKAVLEGALAPHRTGEGRIHVRGPDVQLEPKQALSLVLSIHELATNATKYGALSVESGTIAVTWDCRTSDDGGRTLRFEWREAGGPPVSPPTRRGFGSRLIEATLSADFGGDAKIDYKPDGLVCTFETTLPK
jgi:PAS domain S-box-containing protein